ncbi:hypothetical protein ANAPH1_00437 [Anaplasma phagocytophilum]|nr:hypothetical protein ANAPH2_00276 [Anaplasma phagocytophilum]SCV63619.1 hypothetical protein ANAPH1_00437 [Anaplasma phagocytophilum]
MLGFLGLSCQSIELRFRGILLFTARLVIFCLASLKVHTAHRADFTVALLVRAWILA